jgi:hypothetical protein
MREIHSYNDAQNLVLHFEKTLSGLGITIKQGSTLEKLCLNVIDIHEKYLHSEQRPDGSVDIRKLYREFLGLSDFAAKIVCCKTHKEFNKLKPHLELLNEGAAVQNSKSSVLDQSNNKLFELFVACLCMGAGSQSVELDDPNSPAGDNPDVLASFDGVKWGFGCKALHSKHATTIYENLGKAVKQIDRSPAEIGLPVLSAKNIIDHDRLWPVVVDPNSKDELIFGAFLGISQPTNILLAFADDLRARVVAVAGEQAITELFANSKSKPACLIYLPTATSILLNGNPVPTRLNIFSLIAFAEGDERTWKMVATLNHQLQLMS